MNEGRERETERERERERDYNQQQILRNWEGGDKKTDKQKYK